jgi:oligopeptide transport system substrate-binding protein
VLRAFIVIAILAACFVAIGSGSSTPRADLVVYNGQEPTTLDPQRLSWIPDMRIARIVYEPLVQHDVLDWDAPVRPAAAESWTVSDDGLTYTFTIRDDARWSNGERLTSEHFRYAWRRGMLPDIASDYAAMFRYVRGADEFYEWRSGELAAIERGDSAYTDGLELWDATLERFDRTVGLSAPDDSTFIVELKEPLPYFIDLCAFAVFCPVYPPLVERYETPDVRTGRLNRRPGWTRPPAIVSNGAFMVADWKFKRGMRLEQNPHYWNRDALNVRTIDVPSIGDPSAAVLAFRTGAVDLMTDVSAPYRGEIVRDKLAYRAEHAEEVDQMRARGLDPFAIDAALPPDPRSRAHIVPAFGTYFWNFNCSPTLADGRPNPFADSRVRRAFALVVDKRSIADQVRRLGEPTAMCSSRPARSRGTRAAGGPARTSAMPRPTPSGRRSSSARSRSSPRRGIPTRPRTSRSPSSSCSTRTRGTT